MDKSKPGQKFMKIIIGLVCGLLLGFIATIGAQVVRTYRCDEARWTGPVELTDFHQTIELGFCPDGLVLWRPQAREHN
jgi:hypothetical protein